MFRRFLSTKRFFNAQASLVPYVIEQTSRGGERAMDMYDHTNLNLASLAY
jgi:hypothetical protein